MDAGLAVLGVFAVMEIDGKLNDFAKKLGKKVSTLIAIIVVLCLGPLIAIPRTGAVTYSMGVKPLLGITDNNTLALFIFSLLFFALVLFFSVKPGKVVDIIGTYMTPILLIFLVLMIILGIVYVSNDPATVLVACPIEEGISNGYQTMDGMASMLLSGIVIKSVYGSKEYSNMQAKKIISLSSFIACILLFIVYGGLTYLGAVWGQPMGTLFMSQSIDQAVLLTYIVGQVMGPMGVFVIAIITLFACLTTAVGLTTASAEYFEQYRKCAIPSSTK